MWRGWISWWRGKVPSGAASGSNPAMSKVEKKGAVPHPRHSKQIKVADFQKKSCDQLDILLKGDCEENCSLQSDQQGELILCLCCHLVDTPHMAVKILSV